MKLLKRRKKEESMIRHKWKKQKCKLECIGKKMHVEEASTRVEPSSDQVPLVEDRLQREKSNVQMGKKKRLLKRSWDSQETKGKMKSQSQEGLRSNILLLKQSKCEGEGMGAPSLLFSFLVL
eukprot:Gb_29503 [translate_table: standard]